MSIKNHHSFTADLISFAQNSSGISVQMGISIQNNDLKLKFLIQDPKDQTYRPDPEFNFSRDMLKRKNELWNRTCFELFWGQKSKANYFELNFNFTGDWNIYHFNSYRDPQPPREVKEMSITEVKGGITSATQWEILANLTSESHFELENLEISPTAIVKTKKGDTLYFAFSHEKKQADFHERSSFRSFNELRSKT